MFTTTTIEVREDADGRRTGTAAVRSMARYFRRELKTVDGAIRIGEESIARGEGDVAETRRSVEEVRRRRADLIAGWKNRSLRVPDDENGERAAVEQRMVAVPSRADPAVDTGTSTLLTAKRLEGYAAVFNVPTIIFTPFGQFQEVVAPGAFARALRISDIRLLYNHDPNFLYARSSAATLELREDAKGLHFVAYLLPFDAPSYQLARRVDRKDISGCSFSFRMADDDSGDEWFLPPGGGLARRTIKSFAELYDVGPVTFPAYKKTSVVAIFEKVPARSAAPARDLEPPAETYEQFSERFEREYDEQLVAQNRQRPVSPGRQAELVKRLREVRNDLLESRLVSLEKRLRTARYGWPWLKKS